MRKLLVLATALMATCSALFARQLPDKWVEYIESTGDGQYIDTGIVPGTTTKVWMKFLLKQNNGSHALFGQTWTGSRYLLNVQGGGWFYFHGNGARFGQTQLDVDYEVTVTPGASPNVVITYDNNGTPAQYSCSENLNSDGTKLHVFATSNGGNAAKMRLYGMQIWKNGELVRDFHPCVKNTEPALYDGVSDTFFFDKKRASTQFNVGPDALSPYFEISGAMTWNAATKTATVVPQFISGTGPVTFKTIVTNPDGTVVTNDLPQAGAALSDFADNSSYGLQIYCFNELGDDAFYDLGGIYTGSVSVSAGSNANEGTMEAGSFTVSRGSGAADIANALTVKYTVGGTAEAGSVYEALSGEVTIPAGARSATVPVNPLYNESVTVDKTVSLTLAAGGYTIGAAATASISVRNGTAGWLYANNTITQLDATGTAWVLNTTISGKNLTISSVATPGSTDNSVVDLRKAIADSNGTSYQIVSIADSAFKNKGDFFTEIKLPDTVTSIANNAFSGSAYLESVRLSANLRSIGSSAFYNCQRLISVSPFLPDSLTSLGSQAFDNCYRLPAPCLRLGYGPSPLSFGTHAFRNCQRIQAVDFGPNLGSTIPAYAFQQCYALTTMSIPDCVTSIDIYALNKCSGLTSLRLSANLRTTGTEAISQCSVLATVTPAIFPESMTSIGQQTYDYCYKLEGTAEIGFGGHPVTLNGYALRECRALTGLRIGPGVTSIPQYLAQNCKSLETVELHQGITRINQFAFNACSALTTVTPEEIASLTQIDEQAFYQCSALSWQPRFGFNGPFTFNGSYQLASTATRKLTLGPGVTSIPGSLCRSCSSLTEVVLTNTITSIGGNAFSSCSKLERINLEEGITTIGSSAFESCSKLVDLGNFLPSTVTSVGQLAFYKATALPGKVYFATNGVAASMGNYAFSYTSVSEAELGDGITSIPAYAFDQCSKLESLKLPANLTSIGNYAFRECRKLASIEPRFPMTLTSLGNDAFESCLALDGTFTFGPDFTSIANYVFFNNTKISKCIFYSKPTISGNPFYGWGNYQAMFVVDKDSQGWADYIASNCKTWDELTDNVKAQYAAKFPGEPTPRGLTKANQANQWVVSYGMAGEGVKELTVNGLPVQYESANVTPAYGIYSNAVEALHTTFTAPQYSEVGTTLYESSAWIIESPTLAGWGSPVTNEITTSGPRSVSYAMSEDGERRFSWLWTEAGYQVAVQQPSNPDTVGYVTKSEPDVNGYYSYGSTVTLTAVPGSGSSFKRWYGDVPAGYETANPLEITMDGPKTITPEFASTWVYDTSTHKISDGLWTLNATGPIDAIVIGTVVTPYAVGILDFTKPIANGGVITAIGDSAFFKNSSIVEVRLPNTIVTIGESSFREMSNLTTVTPLLPKSVRTIKHLAFYSSPKLTGDLTIGDDHGEAIAINGDSHFYNTKITSLTMKPGVTKVPTSFCYANSLLATVTLNDGITSIGENGFRQCGSLTTVEPLLPASLTSLGHLAFYADSALRGDLVIGTNGVAVTMSGDSNFYNTRVTTATFGDGVTKIPNAFLQANSAITSVSMSDRVTRIGGYAFQGCGSLTNVVPFLPEDIEFVGQQAFYNSSKLKSALVAGTHGRTVKFDVNWCFGSTSISSATLGDGVKSLPTSCFESAGIKSVSMSGMETIGESAFKNCSKLTYVRLPDTSLHTIGRTAFQTCGALTTVEPFLPESVTNLDYCSFYQCGSLSSPLTFAGRKRTPIKFKSTHAFASCGNIKKATIGCVEGWAENTFDGDTRIKDFYIMGDVLPTKANTFNNWSAEQCRIYIPKTSETWMAWRDENVIPWAQLSPDERTRYLMDKFPGEKPPYGKSKSTAIPANQWVNLWNPFPNPTMMLFR